MMRSVSIVTMVLAIIAVAAANPAGSTPCAGVALPAASITIPNIKVSGGCSMADDCLSLSCSTGMYTSLLLSSLNITDSLTITINACSTPITASVSGRVSIAIELVLAAPPIIVNIPASPVALNQPVSLYNAGGLSLNLQAKTFDFLGAGSSLQAQLSLSVGLSAPLNIFVPNSNFDIYSTPVINFPMATLAKICTPPAIPAAPSSSSTCFPSTSQVQLEDGSSLTMDTLTVGHKVRVGAKEFSEVFMFSHQYTDAQATFVELQTATGNLQLSAGHYLYVNGKAATASSVKVGDLLETATGAPAAVTGIMTVRANGLYNPHTMQGDIIVNGFRTTTYTEAIIPTLAHALLAPVRAMHAMNITF